MKTFEKMSGIIVILLIIIFIAACTSHGEVTITRGRPGQMNKALSMKLTLEHGVLSGQVFLIDGIATAKIIADNDLEINKLEIVQKYAEILRIPMGIVASIYRVFKMMKPSLIYLLSIKTLIFLPIN